MQTHDLNHLLSHRGIRILRAQQAPLIIGFFLQVFKSPHRLSVLESEILRLLQHRLFDLHQQDPEQYQRKAADYLKQWVEAGYLRKYYRDQDEPEYELTPEVEQMLSWLQSLEKREFVGTESRLHTVISHLQTLVAGTDDNLERQRQTLQAQINELQTRLDTLNSGQLERLDQRLIREYWQEARESAQRLLSDFREVEANFQHLNQALRQHILESEDKGQVITELLFRENQIDRADQGQSFSAFLNLLTQPSAHRDLESLLNALENVSEVPLDPFMQALPHHLLREAQRIQHNKAQLYQQLKAYLGQQPLAERRQLTIELQQLELSLEKMRDQEIPRECFVSDELRADILLPLERTAYAPTQREQFQAGSLSLGQASELNTELLFSGFNYQPELLLQKLALVLREQPRISLQQLCERFPPRHGVQEIIYWLQLAQELAARPQQEITAQLGGDLLELDAAHTKAGYSLRLRLPDTYFYWSHS